MCYFDKVFYNVVLYYISWLKMLILADLATSTHLMSKNKLEKIVLFFLSLHNHYQL